MAASDPEVVLYFSSVASSVAARKCTTAINSLFAAHSVAHKAIDVSLPEHKEALLKMQELSGKKELPQVFVRGVFRGASSSETYC
jgi:glutaredoxin